MTERNCSSVKLIALIIILLLGNANSNPDGFAAFGFAALTGGDSSRCAAGYVQLI
jgi:hypothetical protein